MAEMQMLMFENQIKQWCTSLATSEAQRPSRLILYANFPLKNSTKQNIFLKMTAQKYIRYHE